MINNRIIYFGIPTGASIYIIVKNKKVIRTAKVVGAVEARRVLKPKTNEELYIKVGHE